MLRSVLQCLLLWGNQEYETGYIFSLSSANKENELSDKENYSIQQKGSFKQLFEIRTLGVSDSFRRPLLKDREKTLMEYGNTSLLP